MGGEKGYSVEILNKDKIEETVCYDDNDLINLVVNLDRSKYKICAIKEFRTEDMAKLVGDKLKPFKNFTKKYKNLETGGENVK